MNYYPFTIREKTEIVPETYRFVLVPNDSHKIFSFLPGQYVYVKNPAFSDPEEEHPFSIASSPTNTKYLEFCIKVYGDWTEKLTELKPGDHLFVSEPSGDCIWKDEYSNAVFLLGGIGISPVMSMLQYIRDKKLSPTITMLYGNRTPDTIAYKDELAELSKHMNLTIIDIFSHLPDDHPWEGYRGFITQDIVEREVNLSTKAIFFVIGPPIFTEKMKTILANLNVSKENIREERLEKKL